MLLVKVWKETKVMKILYMCMGNPFTENMLYKENYYIKAYAEQGDNVLVVADPRRYNGNQIEYVKSGEYNISQGVKVKRCKFNRCCNNYLTYKYRRFDKFENIVDIFLPDYIIVNCMQSYYINDIKKIKKKHPDIRIIGESSVTLYNSATNFISYHILHGLIYRNWIEKNIGYFDKMFYVAPECKEFYEKVYKINTKAFEFRPLPAQIITAETREVNNKEIRKKYNINQDSIVFAHSGKMNNLKMTLDIMKAFSDCKNNNMYLLLAGVFDEEIREEVIQYINKDKRIIYLGMLSGDKLTKMLCACDMYLQPGSPSQTAQTAIGAGCAVVLPKVTTYEYIIDGNGYLISSVEELGKIISDISERKVNIDFMKIKSFEMANKMLDYKKLANKIFDNTK